MSTANKPDPAKIAYTADLRNRLQTQPRCLMFITADWCGHCKNLHPTIKHLKDSVHNTYFKVTVEDVNSKLVTREFLQEMQVRGYPTILLMSHGKKVAQYRMGPRTPEPLGVFAASTAIF